MADPSSPRDIELTLSTNYRTLSPSPSISPTLASSAYPTFDRSLSSGSEYSSRLSAGSSRASNVSSTSNTSRRRGYVRPQGATFAESARNRDSVMSLGSIAHLQYYFARTGLLDGKGAQLAREKKRVPSSGDTYSMVESGSASPRTPPSTIFDEQYPKTIEEDDDEDYEWEIDPMMLPPTVSTYNHKEHYIPPPPDTNSLRIELIKSLEHVSSTIANVREEKIDKEARAKELARSGRNTPPIEDPNNPTPPAPLGSPGRGWHEIQGMHVLDVVTLAIKAAKDYYTMHEHPLRLNKVKSERQIREELLGVMDVLKRMGVRSFAGGMRAEEVNIIDSWVVQVQDFLEKEKQVEAQEEKDSQSWIWLEGNWFANDRDREWEFLKTFVEEGEDIPNWMPADQATELPTPFLEKFSNGLLLIHLHNRILKKSKRQFGEIKSFHTDFARSYRAAENLRYWIKAAEIRWEIKLELDVMALVYNKGPDAWIQFDKAVIQWCQAVRSEITKEWKSGAVNVPAIRQLV